ncbi:MAG: bifunctional riboflavin kinase/FAD synthetase [Elusimicrobiota bacterium]|jgi:riboflavin kinase/FMN adenylyltransferase|nr:bifunctional riboflavin kinase/FAD synthetase [Elusimicrobiota bacterium]
MKTKFSVITIGTFDGVHKGHQKLIKETIKSAKKKGFESIAVALEKPVKNINSILSLPDEKIKQIEYLEPDKIVLIPVPSEILSETSTDFLRNFIIKRLKAKEIICGADFAFGKDRKGNVAWLKNNAKEFGLKIKVVSPVKIDSKIVSSSYIRTLITKGKIEKVNKLLGRNFGFYGMPFREKGLGKKLGFPTINLKTDKSKLLPKGIFISLIEKGSKLYPAITNMGVRPTINADNNLVPEVHILNFKGVWGKSKTQVYLIKKIRAEKKFPSLEALKKQIKKDKEKAKRYFKI